MSTRRISYALADACHWIDPWFHRVYASNGALRWKQMGQEWWNGRIMWVARSLSFRCW